MKTLFGFLLFLITLGTYAQKITTMAYFDFSQSELSVSSQKKLEYFIDSLMTKNDILRINLFGHCDTIGNAQFNDSLSIKRVNTIKELLISKGIIDTVFKIQKGYGKQNPVNQNLSETDRSLNRRVEIVLYTKRKVPGKTLPQNKPTPIVQIDTTNLKVGSKIVLKNILFEGGMHVFLKSSYETLKELLALMQNNPTLKIEIVGYICCYPENGGDGYDIQTGRKNLSEARAEAVVGYLVSNGIDPKRLTYRGMGAKNKITAERTPEEESINRRVELIVISR